MRPARPGSRWPALLAAGIDCVIAAPGKIERPAQDRVKTDRRDAPRLLQTLAERQSAVTVLAIRLGAITTRGY
ncbi:MAG TPA: hypothetical protein VGH56_02670 [Solirubrobacteraceae bacterium]|jgi:hypothetical protein